jgi:hypothetical protein
MVIVDLLQGKRDLLQGKRDLLILAYLSGACYIPHIRMYLEARELQSYAHMLTRFYKYTYTYTYVSILIIWLYIYTYINPKP